MMKTEEWIRIEMLVPVRSPDLNMLKSRGNIGMGSLWAQILIAREENIQRNQSRSPYHKL